MKSLPVSHQVIVALTVPEISDSLQAFADSRRAGYFRFQYASISACQHLFKLS